MNLILTIVTLIQLQLIGTAELRTQQNIWERIDQKAAELRNGRTEYSELKHINPGFSEFYKRFITDSTFQQERVNEGVLAAIGLCESTKILTPENWELITYHYKEDFDDPRYEHLIISDENAFYLRSTLTEIGVISQIGFERIEGGWQITLYMVNAC